MPGGLDAYIWADLDWLMDDIMRNSDKYTVWFKMIIENNFNEKYYPSDSLKSICDAF